MVSRNFYCVSYDRQLISEAFKKLYEAVQGSHRRRKRGMQLVWHPNYLCGGYWPVYPPRSIDVSAMSDSDVGDQQILITVSTIFQNFVDVPFISTCGRHPVHECFPLSSSSSFAFNHPGQCNGFQPVFELHASQSMPGPLTSREGPHT